MQDMTYNSKMTLSQAKIVIQNLQPEEVHPDDLVYIQALYDQLYKFFKSRFNNQWQFDLWRSRYVD